MTGQRNRLATEPDGSPVHAEVPGMPGWRTLVPVFLTSLTLPIDDALILPSIWGYVQELGGDAKVYGWIQVTYYAARILSMPTVGFLVGRWSYSMILSSLLVLGILASLLYTVSLTVGRVVTLLLSRALLGIASSASVASIAYIAEHVPAEHRRTALSINFGLQRACIPLAPALNVLVVRLPNESFSWLKLTEYSYAGVLMAALNSLLLLCMLLLHEPPRSRAQLSTPAPKAGEIYRTLVRTGAYFSYVMSFQNNWTNQVVLWTLPLITSQLYPFLGITGNSLLLASGGVTGFLTVCTLPRATRGMSDRVVLLLSQLSMAAVLCPFTLLYGCNLSQPPVWVLWLLFCSYNVPFMAQMPANNAIYTKLIGARSQGVYISLLEMSKTVGRLIAGYLIGVAYASLGPCSLWAITMGVWAVQFVPFLGNWNRLAMCEAGAN